MSNSRNISWQQVVTESDADYWLNKRKPVKYEFSNGRLFYSPGEDDNIYVSAAQYFDTVLGIPLFLVGAGDYANITGATVDPIDPEPTTALWDVGEGIPVWLSAIGYVNGTGSIVDVTGPLVPCVFLGMGIQTTNNFADVYSFMLDQGQSPVIPMWYMGSGSWVDATGV